MSDLRSSPDPTIRSSPVGGSRAFQYTLIGVLFGAAFPVFATTIRLAASQAPWNLASIVDAHRMEPLLWIIDTAPLFLGIFARIAGTRADALEAGNRELRSRERELTATKQTLQLRVDERTRALEDRNQELRRAVHAARSIAQAHTPGELAGAAVQSLARVVQGFAVELFLVDEQAASARLAATSDPNSESSAEPGSSVVVGDASLVGQAAAQARVFTSDPHQAVKQLALPLIAGGRTLGVIRFHSSLPDSRVPTDIEPLHLLADQLASTLESARHFEEAQALVGRMQAVSADRTQSDWQERLATRGLAFSYKRPGSQIGKQDGTSEETHELKVPLDLRGSRIGTVTLRRAAEQGWSDADRDFAEKVATQTALALDNVRLIDETRSAATQQQRMSEFSARVGASVDVQSLLQTAVRELAALPDVADAAVFLKPATPDRNGGSS